MRSPPAVTCFNSHRLCLGLGSCLQRVEKPRHQVQLRNYFHPKLFLSFCTLSKRIWRCLKGSWCLAPSWSHFPASLSQLKVWNQTVWNSQTSPHPGTLHFPISCTSNLEIQSGFQYKSILYTHINVCCFQLSKHSAVCDTPQGFGVFSPVFGHRNRKRCVVCRKVTFASFENFCLVLGGFWVWKSVHMCCVIYLSWQSWEQGVLVTSSLSLFVSCLSLIITSAVEMIGWECTKISVEQSQRGDHSDPENGHTHWCPWLWPFFLPPF